MCSAQHMRIQTQEVLWSYDITKGINYLHGLQLLKCFGKSNYKFSYPPEVFSVFISHVIKTNNRNRSRNKSKNLGYDRWLQYKQPCQESGLCCFSFARYSQKCVNQIYRDLYGDAMLVPLRMGTRWTWRPETNRNICHWVLLKKRKFISRGTQSIKMILFLIQKPVKIAKFPEIVTFLTNAAVL